MPQGQEFKERCEAHGVSYSTAIKRQQRGMSDEEIFSSTSLRLNNNAKKISVGGVEYPSFEAARKSLKSTASISTIRRRIKKGMSPESAFSLPPGLSGGAEKRKN